MTDEEYEELGLEERLKWLAGKLKGSEVDWRVVEALEVLERAVKELKEEVRGLGRIAHRG